MKYIFPLVPDFRATTLPRAFLLNAVATAAIAALAIEMRSQLDNQKSRTYGYFNSMFEGESLSERDKIIIVFSTALIGALVVYHMMYALVGFGGGMLTGDSKVTRY
jgi:hypothetical protein